MNQYFPIATFLVGNVKVGVDLSNYATKADLETNWC